LGRLRRERREWRAGSEPRVQRERRYVAIQRRPAFQFDRQSLLRAALKVVFSSEPELFVAKIELPIDALLFGSVFRSIAIVLRAIFRPIALVFTALSQFAGPAQFGRRQQRRSSRRRRWQFAWRWQPARRRKSPLKPS
jgi:hypothetical protein